MTTSTTLELRSIVNGRPTIQVVGEVEGRFSPVDPRTGIALEEFAQAGRRDIEDAARLATEAAPALAATTPSERSALLREIGAQLESRREELVARAELETALGLSRLDGELTRTIVQLAAFAAFVADGGHLHASVDRPTPGGPAGELRRMTLPLGVVAVFGASNFPFAFSTPGGDTASALAAGCPVVVKGHPSHPGTSEIAARAIAAAIHASGLPAGCFALLQGTDPTLSTGLVSHPLVSAVGFTGSRAVGRILHDTAAARDLPIQVHAEMGSTNPLFVTTAAIRARGVEIARGLTGSILQGSGQFCTKPGLVLVPSGAEGDAFVSELAEEFGRRLPGPLLNGSVRDRYERQPTGEGRERSTIATTILGSDALSVTGELIEVAWDEVDEHPELLEERFGPAAVILRLAEADFARAASELDGQLTATVHGESEDAVGLDELLRILALRAGRIVWNGYPTGVAVSPAMTHGGPYPAASTPTSSVGLTAIDRFLRPVTFQDFPDELLPAALRLIEPR
jgi:acyl-CoA reductase-like NAD-dependent aldehyde dehydrogenase